MLQASLSVAIIFASYALQVKYRPFIDPGTRSEISSASIADYTANKDAVRGYAMPYNRLETGYLLTSMFTLLAGMIFQSGYVSASSKTYLFLTILARAYSAVCVHHPLLIRCVMVQVGAILVGSVVLFLGMIIVEVLNAIRHSHRLQAADRNGTLLCVMFFDHDFGPNSGHYVLSLNRNLKGSTVVKPRMLSNPLARAMRRSVAARGRISQKPISARNPSESQSATSVPVQLAQGELKM